MGNLKGLVMRSILLCLLGHEADIGDIAHGGDIKGSIGLAETYGFLVDAGITAIRDDRLGVTGISVRSPHSTGSPDHCRHRGINDDVARDVQVCTQPI